MKSSRARLLALEASRTLSLSHVTAKALKEKVAAMVARQMSSGVSLAHDDAESPAVNLAFAFARGDGDAARTILDKVVGGAQ